MGSGLLLRSPRNDRRGAHSRTTPAAVINAITDALGHEDIAMPATPQAVWRAAQRARVPMAAE